MAINVSGTPGNCTTQETIYIDSAPDFWWGGVHYNNPDSNSYYWGLSGTAANPCYKVGCVSDFIFRDDRDQNAIICDNLGHVGLREVRNFVEATFTLKSLLPLSTIDKIMRAGTVTTDLTENIEEMGIGEITGANTYYRAFLKRVYEPVAQDYVSVTIHRAQFVNAFEIAMPYADAWNMPVTVRGFADSSLPTEQRFATVVRYDPSVL